MSVVLSPSVYDGIEIYLDTHSGAFQSIGQELWALFSAGDNERISSQVRNLQQIAISATRFGDVEDFVKNQMGRTTANAQQWRLVGPRLLDQLSTLRRDATALSNDPATQLEIRLRLARGWVRTVVSEFLYRKALGGVTS